MFHYKRSAVILLFCLLLTACSSDEESHKSGMMVKDSVLPSPSANQMFDGGSSLETKSTKQTPSASSNKPSIAKAKQQNRKITYKATVRLTVADYKKTRTKIESLVDQHQGYLVNSTERKEEHSQYGHLTFRVPENEFKPFLKNLQSLGKQPPDLEINGEDVTEEMVDLDSRLKAKKATEARLLALMSKATESTALLEISRQLDQTQVEIEELQGRLTYLNHRIDYSEANVQLTQPINSPASNEEPLLKQMGDSFNGSIDTLFYLGNGLLVFLAGSLPILILLFVVLIPLYLFYRRNKRTKTKITPPSTEDE